MLKTNLEILQIIKTRLEIAKKDVRIALNAYLKEDIYSHETISKNLADYESEYEVQLVLESLIDFIENGIK